MNTDIGSLDKVPKPRWNIRPRNGERAQEFAVEIRNLAELEWSRATTPCQLKQYRKIADASLKTLATLLLNRGIDNGPAALRFLCPDQVWLHDWNLLPDMEVALARLNRAKEEGEKILIHGDYDADGITATALLVLAFADWGLDLCWYLPHRQEDGYGLSRTGIQQGRDKGATLMVTVDCGISNTEEVEYAKSLGMDVIITDHHLPPDELPLALAVVNPKRSDSVYPFPDLAGVGLAWKLAMALNPGGKSSAYLQLAALGTVADLVPLLDENRIFASLGIAEINHHPLPGIAALSAVSGCQLGRLDSTSIAYALAPRLNAAGRMGSADSALALLLEEDSGVAAHLAQGLDAENKYRRQVEDSIFQEALIQAQEQVKHHHRVLVIHGGDWHPGVLGIVASRIVDKYYRPTLILSGHDLLTGSARSIPGFDIHGALTAGAEYLDSYGGHSGAAGLTLRFENIQGFRIALDAFACQENIDVILQQTIDLDASLTPPDIGKELVEEIGLLHPFGRGNPEPTFAVEGFSASNPDLVGRDKSHLRLRLDSPGSNFWAIGFGKASLVHNIDIGSSVRVAGHLHLNQWKGHTSVQLQLSDLEGPSPPRYQDWLIFDRRSSSEPWLTQLAQAPGTVFFANTRWSARHILGSRAETARVIILISDSHGKKVYNLEAEDFCFLDPAWSWEQLKALIAYLPRGRRLHFFSSTIPEDVLRPNLNLLRIFYRAWREEPLGETKLLSLLPPDLAEPILLERILAIFAEAGLVSESLGEWELTPVQGNVDLTTTQAWTRYSSQLEEYRGWLQNFADNSLDQLLD